MGVQTVVPCLSELDKKIKLTTKNSIGDLWLDFLRYYDDFNWENVVSIRSRKLKKSNSSTLMFIENPSSLKNLAISNKPSCNKVSRNVKKSNYLLAFEKFIIFFNLF